MVIEIGYKILIRLIFTSKKLAWRVAVAWTENNDYYIVPKNSKKP